MNKKSSGPEINKKKLFKELAVIFGVLLVIFLIRFLPWLAQQPIPGYNPNAKYQDLVNEVEKYDYSKGSDPELEDRLDSSTKFIGSAPTQYYFNQKAKAIYYYNLGKYSKSLSALGEAINFAPSPEEIYFVHNLYVEIYTKQYNDEKVEEHKKIRDGIIL